MAEYADREHYIPLRKSDLVDMLCKDSKLPPEQRDDVRRFCQLVGAVWHFEYYETLEKLKDLFAPFDPDKETIEYRPLPGEKRPKQMEALFEQFIHLMERANFKRLTRRDIDAAIEGGASDWGINMDVNWDVFEHIEVFVRGDQEVTRTKKHWLWWWQTVSSKVPSYRRVVLLLKLRKHHLLPESVDTNAVYLKVFKDIPKLDLEMILPGTSLQMPWSQQLKLGGSLLGTLGYAIYSLGWKMYAAILAILGLAAKFTFAAVEYALIAPFVILFGYGYKQWYTWQVTKTEYAKMLVESLYYQNLDNNLGVVTRLLDEAEEQECRETILAYFYLAKHAPPQGWTSEQLDDYVEMELEGQLNMKVDFEIGDALDKLERLKIVTKHGDYYRAVSLEKALEALDYRWDNYFQYNLPPGSPPPTSKPVPTKAAGPVAKDSEALPQLERFE
jgi:hypothetical protein